MSFTGNNPKFNTVRYNPQSTLPSNPEEGSVFRSDGTAIPKGLWEYRDAVWKRVGSGSGVLNFYENGDADNHSDTSNFSTGNNATFDGGGVLAGTFSISTTAADLINGNNVFKLVGDATAGNNTNDYVASQTIDIPQGYRGRNIGIQFQYKWDGAATNLVWRVKDTTNNVILTDDNELLEVSAGSDNIAKEFSTAFFCPSDCTQIEIGPQILTGESSKTLIWDDVIVSPDPFIDKDLLVDQETSFSAAASTMTSAAAGVLRWSSVTQSGDDLISYDDSNGRFTANRECEVWVSTSLNSASANTIDIRKNGTVIMQHEAAAGSTENVASPVKLSATDYIDINVSAALDNAETQYLRILAQAEEEHVVTPAKAQLTNWEAYTPTFTGFGTATGVDFHWRRNGENVEIRGKFSAGTPTATEAQITLPVVDGSTLAVKAGLSGVQSCGVHFNGVTTNQSGGVILATSGDTYFNMNNSDQMAVGANPHNPANGNAVTSTGDNLTINCSIPVEGWSADATFLAAIPVTKQTLQLVDGVTAPDTNANAQIYVDSADGDLKIKFADGTTKTIITDT